METDTVRTPMKLRDIQLAMNEMLDSFDVFCRRHGLVYSLCSGTLLGAVREQGFIPWDDDLDVSMARPEFEKLLDLADVLQDETGFVLRGHLGIELHDSPFAKLCRTDIVAQPERERDLVNLWVDIFPADGLPEDKDELVEHYRPVQRWQRALMFLGSTPESGHSAPVRLLKLAATPIARSKVLRRHFGRALNKRAKSIPYGSTTFVGHVTWGLAGIFERVRYEGYSKTIDVEFEGSTRMAMSNWKNYLGGLYGPTYMTPPPEDKRASHHIKAWRLDEERVQ